MRCASTTPPARDRIVTIHNGVDTEAFAPGCAASEARRDARLAAGSRDERLVAAFVGGEWERKGLERGRSKRSPRRPTGTLVVAGGGDEKRYRSWPTRSASASAVRWLGVTRDVPLVYQLADAFVLPSSYETFSLVTFEAAASGLPILATPVSGVRELIDDGQQRLSDRAASRARSPSASGALRAADAPLRMSMGEQRARLALRLLSAGRRPEWSGDAASSCERRPPQRCASARPALGAARRAPQQALERVGRGGHREQPLDRRAAAARELASRSSGAVAQLAQPAGQHRAVALGEDEPSAGQLDQPGDLTRVRADHRDAAPQRLDDHPPELLLPRRRGVRGQHEHVELRVRRRHLRRG